MKKTFENDMPKYTLERFVRTYSREFSLRAARDFFVEQGCSLELDDVTNFFHSHPAVFRISDDVYISRAGVFTGKKFSIKPTLQEIKKGILIPGHRTMPFSDPEMIASELTFSVAGVKVPFCVKTLPIAEILPAYDLFGEEFIPQYIAIDPANDAVDFSKKDFALPNQLSVTVLDFSSWYDEWKFSDGDRIIGFVDDWNAGHIVLSVLKDKKKHSFEVTAAQEKREEWFLEFETYFRMALNRYGPCSSIEEQLSYTYFLAGDLLDTPFCGSVEEFLRNSDDIEIKLYGVESRLGLKNIELPALGNWQEALGSPDSIKDTLYYELGIPIPEFMLDAYILDSLYMEEPTLDSVKERMVPSLKCIDKWREGLFLLHMTTRRDILSLTYNKFADFTIGNIRHDVLKLYSEMLKLLCLLDESFVSIEKFPQQPLVVFKQLLGHCSHLAEALIFENDITQSDLFAAKNSIEGMQYSFEDIAGALKNVLKDHRFDGFSVISSEKS